MDLKLLERLYSLLLCVFGEDIRVWKCYFEAISLKIVSAKEFFLTQIKDGMHCLGWWVYRENHLIPRSPVKCLEIVKIHLCVLVPGT